MSDRIVYEIARYGVRGDDEVLLERAQVANAHGACLWRIDDEKTVVGPDMTSAIRNEPTLNEVRANQITRITTTPELVSELPFLPASPGDRDDFDEYAWPDELHDKRVDQEWVNQTGLYRARHVGARRELLETWGY